MLLNFFKSLCICFKRAEFIWSIILLLYIINAFTVTFDQLNASLLNKSLIFFFFFYCNILNSSVYIIVLNHIFTHIIVHSSVDLFSVIVIMLSTFTLVLKSVWLKSKGNALFKLRVKCYTHAGHANTTVVNISHRIDYTLLIFQHCKLINWFEWFDL